MMRALSRPDRLLLLAGGAALTVATAWWAIVFSTVWRADLLGAPQAIECIGLSSGMCSLASALCAGSHFLNIRWYDPSLFWVGVLGLTLGLITQSLRQPQL